MTLDRIKNHLGYSKDNCRWADRETQHNNTRANRVIVVDGVARTVTQWERLLGYPLGTIGGRLYHGWDEVEAVTTRQLKKGENR